MHLPEANLPVTRSLSTRMARWGLVIVGIYLLVTGRLASGRCIVSRTAEE